MSIGFRRRARRALCATGFALAVAGCAALSSPPPAEPPPLDTTQSGSARTYLTLAALREDAADWAGAQAVVEKALTQQPASHAALLRRSQLLLQRATDEDRPELREEARVEIARFADQEDAESRATVAWLAFDDGRRAEALAAVHAAADTDAASPRVQGILAQLLHRNGDFAGAHAAAERAVELAPRSGAALRLRARTRLSLADVGGAASDAREVLRRHRGDPDASLLLAEALARQVDVDGARRALTAVSPDQRNARVLVLLAVLEIAANQPAAARTLLEEAALAQPNDARVHEPLVALDVREDRAGDSVPRLAAAVAARPDDAVLHRLHAQALGAARRDAEAGASFARSLSLEPDDVDTYRALVEFVNARTARNEAVGRLAELGLGSGETLVATGLLLDGRGDRSGARAHYQKALEADADLAVARMLLAESLAASGERLDEALALARAARAARPRDPDAADTLGQVHLRRGQGQAAVDVLSEAAGTYPFWSPGYADVLFHTALALEAIGERDGALNTSEVALALARDRKPEPDWTPRARAIVARAKPAPKPEPKPASVAQAPAAGDAAAPGATPPADTNADATTAAPAPAAAPATATTPSPPPP